METTSRPRAPGHTAAVNDIEMYYETRGEGEPLVLLHGGGGVGATWELVFKAPPQGYRLVIARTLIVHGDRDPLYPVNLAMEMHAAIPRSYLWVISNGGHGPIFGEHTGSGESSSRFAETALAFLRDEWRASS